MPQIISPDEPGYTEIYDALHHGLIDESTGTKEIRRILGSAVSNLTADQIKYRIAKVMENGDKGM